MPMDSNYGAGAEAFGTAGMGTEEPSYEEPALEAEQPVEGEPAAQEPVQDAQPEWDGSQFTLKFRESEKVPESREQLLNWAQKGLLFNEKDQTMSAAIKENERMKSELGELMQVKELWDNDEGFRNKILGLMYNDGQGQQPGQPQLEGQMDQAQESPEIVALRDEITTLKQQLGEYGNYISTERDQKADQELQEEIDKLKADYDWEDWDGIDEQGVTLENQLYQFMDKEGFVNPAHAYRVMRHEAILGNHEAQARKKVMEDFKRQHQEGVVSSDQQAPTPAPRPKPSGAGSYREITDHILANNLVTG